MTSANSNLENDLKTSIKRWIFNIFLTFSSLLIYKGSFAQLGTNDPTFNTYDDGTFGDGYGFLGGIVNTNCVQVDGKILVGGQFTSYNSVVINRIARLNYNGSLDTSFNIGTGFNGNVNCIQIQTDGKILIGGGFNSYNGTSFPYLIRLNTNGSIDPTFNIGIGFNNSVNSIKIQDDGKILVGGLFTTFNGISQNRLLRLYNDGSIDNSFNIGTGFNSDVSELYVNSTGVITVAGSFTSFNGTTKNRITVLNADGSIFTGFNIGTGFNNWVGDIDIQPDGKIIAGGNFTSYNGTSRIRMLRLNPDGTIDNSFNPGTGFNNLVINLKVLSDGSIFGVGSFTTFNGNSANRVVKLNSDGSINSGFVSGTGFGNGTLAISVQPDGKLLIGGAFDLYNGEYGRRCHIRLNQDGSIDSTFNPAPGFNNYINTISIQNDGKIIVGGFFDSFNGVERAFLARLKPDGDLDTLFNSGDALNGFVKISVIQSDQKILVGGAFTSYEGVPMNKLARINVDGSIDATFNIGSGFNNTVNSICIQPDGKIIVGGIFTNFNGIPINRIIRLNQDGSIDPSFNIGTGLDNYVRTLSVQSDGKVVVCGSFYSYNGNSVSQFVRINSDGSFDPTFNIGSNLNLINLKIQPDDKIIVVGQFTSFNGTPANGIVRLNPDGNIDGSFNSGSGFDFLVNYIELQPDNKIIAVGNFTAYNGISRAGLAVLNSDGTLNPDFDPGIGINSNGSINTCAIQDDGKLLIGGWFWKYNDIWRNSIARINNCVNSSTIFSQTSCNSYTWPINGITYTNSGSYYLTLTNIYGCDSIVTLELTIEVTNPSLEIIEVCDSFFWPKSGITYYSSGTFYYTNSCGVIDELILTLNNTYVMNVNVTACNNYTWSVNGLTYNSSGYFEETFTTVQGCDSLISLNLTIIPSDTVTDFVTSCGSYTWPINGYIYTSSGVYNVVLSNIFGCDSVVKLNLIINSPYSISEDVNSCDSYTWSVNGTTYNSSGSYVENLTTSTGCDSILVLNLQLNSSNVTELNVTACDSYTWELNGITYTSSGIWTTVVQGTNGCDSSVTLNLTLNTFDPVVVNQSPLLITPQSGFEYQWLDCNNQMSPIIGANNQTFIATTNGSYALEIVQNGCVDTSDCQIVDNLSVDYLALNQKISCYPNPTSSILFLDLPIKVVQPLVIYNILGQVVFIDPQINNTYKLDFTNFSKGSYFIELNFDNQRIMKHVIID